MGEKILNLSGKWKFKTDPKGVGKYEQWYIGFEGKLMRWLKNHLVLFLHILIIVS